MFNLFLILNQLNLLYLTPNLKIEGSTKIKLNSASKIVPDSSDEELDSIINEMATLNATYSKERNERLYVDNNMNLENKFFEIDRKNDTCSFHESNLHDQIQMISMMT